MICMGCGRRTDPNRSFCTHCGGSVFVDPNERAARSAVATVDQTVTAPIRETFAKQMRAKAAQRPRTAPSAATTTFPIGGLIKLLFFGFVVWKLYGPLMSIPELRDIRDQVLRGESPNFQPALDALRSTFGTATDSAPSAPSEAPPTAPDAPTAPPEPPAPSVPFTRGAPREAATDDVRTRVVTPAANGSVMPVVVRKVTPEYTAEAIREKIQGTVLLRALVQDDGTVANVTVVRSLDRVHGLDQQAVDALKQWVFEPAQRDGTPVRAFVQVELTFSLR